MSLLLGIDTGGTYTDAVLFDPEKGVRAASKALTTRYDLVVGIRRALDGLVARSAGGRPAGQAASGAPAGGFPEVELVSLSTTLATNALVEGQGSPICLLLIGYTPESLAQSGLRRVMAGDPVVFIQGGHDAEGQENAPVDLEAARQAVERHASRVSAFAVSGYFSVRNPEHENRVRGLIRESCGLPVTCGHELTSNLHAPRRAVTAALNARLVPLLERLILAVRGLLQERGIRAPLTVVKGDGSLVDAGFALEYPIETILSGPAASVVGAMHLSEEREAVVVDMGGTTTDIALLAGGGPELNRKGAIVGEWQTMVEAIKVHTSGLGGDSEVHRDPGGELLLGPRRLQPLSLLGAEHPGTVEELSRQLARKLPAPGDGRFLLPGCPPEQIRGGLSDMQRRILEAFAAPGAGPVPLGAVLRLSESEYLVDLELRRLVERGILMAAGFTPTDACHVLGRQQTWSVEAARLGAALAARALPGSPDAQLLCREVMERVVLQSARAVVAAVLEEEHGLHVDRHESFRRVFVDGALVPGRGGAGEGEASGWLLSVALRLGRQIVALGAPVATYYPEVARGLGTRLVVPPHAEIANAIGAVAGSVVQTARVLITPVDSGERFRVHHSGGVQDFQGLEEAAEFAAQRALEEAGGLARRAGTPEPRVTVDRRDRTARARDEELFLESVVSATATGRPPPAG